MEKETNMKMKIDLNSTACKHLLILKENIDEVLKYSEERDVTAKDLFQLKEKVNILNHSLVDDSNVTVRITLIDSNCKEMKI